jgi:YVTN family beta-propeller protein
MKSSVRYAPLCGIMALAASAVALAQSVEYPTYAPGPQANGTYVMSTGQVISPAGTIVNLSTSTSTARGKAVALNPAVPGIAAALVMGAPESVEVFSTVTGKILQEYSPAGTANGSFTGISYTPDGTKLVFSQDEYTDVVVANSSSTGWLTDNKSVVVAPSQAYTNCAGVNIGATDPTDPTYFNYTCGQFYNGNNSSSNPAGIAISADSTTAYAVLNGNNTLQPISLTGTPALAGTQIPVGNAPNSVVLNGTTAYVSNEGGRRATPSDFTGYSNGTAIVANTVNGSAATGTVSIVNLTTGAETGEITVGLHPTGMTIANGLLYVCNTYSDSVSVINTATNAVIGTIDLALPLGLPNSSFGAEPQNIVVVGTKAYVTLYTANAIAVVDLTNNIVIGYIPTASTPTTISYDATHNTLVVANDKGLGTWGSLATAHGVKGYNSHQDVGTAEVIAIPSSATLTTDTTQVVQNNHWDLTQNVLSAQPAEVPAKKAVAIPAHLGDPSLIKHVFLLVRENRTYDQILGDVKKGNGDPSLTIYGAGITPNAHALVTRFPLLDNYYNPSRQSADGHNWLVQAMAPYFDDITSPDWTRSYPANGEDALAYNPHGFLWDAAEKQGLKVKIFGEYVEYTGYNLENPTINVTRPSWAQFYDDAMAFEAGQESTLQYQNLINVHSEIPSVQAAIVPNFPPFDLSIPDQFRVDLWLQNFNADVANNSVPALTLIWLSDDHTGGPPSGPAEQADNDLAVGRIVDYISHSPVWGSSAIFITEDDAQDGVDHVDGHRSPGYIASPYVKNEVSHVNWTQVNMTRTIEQILGLPPINQFDLTASPMYKLFDNKANLEPFNHVPALISLTTGVQ